VWHSDPIPGHGLTLRVFTIPLRHAPLGGTPLDEWWARPRDLYLTTHNIHKRETSILPAGFEPHNYRMLVAADPPLRPRGHWDRHVVVLPVLNWEPRIEDVWEGWRHRSTHSLSRHQAGMSVQLDGLIALQSWKELAHTHGNLSVTLLFSTHVQLPLIFTVAGASVL